MSTATDPVDVQAMIARNLPPDLDGPRGWLPTAADHGPPELMDYLEARQNYMVAAAAFTTAGERLVDLINLKGGRIEHAGYCYSVTPTGISIKQV